MADLELEIAGEWMICLPERAMYWSAASTLQITAWRVRCVDEAFIEGIFAFAHLPAVVEGYYTLSGHLCPGVVLSGKARQEVMLPCFWFQRDQAVLPAFGQFTGLAPVSARRGDRVIAIAENQVIEFSC